MVASEGRCGQARIRNLQGASCMASQLAYAAHGLIRNEASLACASRCGREPGHRVLLQGSGAMLRSGTRRAGAKVGRPIYGHVPPQPIVGQPGPPPRARARSFKAGCLAHSGQRPELISPESPVRLSRAFRTLRPQALKVTLVECRVSRRARADWAKTGRRHNPAHRYAPVGFCGFVLASTGLLGSM